MRAMTLQLDGVFDDVEAGYPAVGAELDGHEVYTPVSALGAVLLEVFLGGGDHVLALLWG